VLFAGARWRHCQCCKLSSDTTALELEQTLMAFDSITPNRVMSSNFFGYDETGNLIDVCSNGIERIE